MTHRDKDQIRRDVQHIVWTTLVDNLDSDGSVEASVKIGRALEDAGLLIPAADLTERHIVKYHQGGFTILHPAAERANGGQGLFDCEVFSVAKASILLPYQDGKFYCGLDDGGEFCVYGRVE